MIKISENVYSLFEKKVNILIVDDEDVVLQGVSAMFNSPMINIFTAKNPADASKIISVNSPWHCWILDIALDQQDDGLDILIKHEKFPFSVMLSGLGSMTTASNAIKLGAMKVFDKDPASLELLIDEVIKIAVLGFILGGKGSQYLPFYEILTKKSLYTANEWADFAFLTVRQAERICAIHSQLSPRLVISFYYTLYYLLSADLEETSQRVSQNSSVDGVDFYQQHVNFVERNISKYRDIISA